MGDLTVTGKGLQGTQDRANMARMVRRTKMQKSAGRDSGNRKGLAGQKRGQRQEEGARMLEDPCQRQLKYEKSMSSPSHRLWAWLDNWPTSLEPKARGAALTSATQANNQPAQKAWLCRIQSH